MANINSFFSFNVTLYCIRSIAIRWTCKQILHCDVTFILHPASAGGTEIYIRSDIRNNDILWRRVYRKSTSNNLKHCIFSKQRSVFGSWCLIKLLYAITITQTVSGCDLSTHEINESTTKNISLKKWENKECYLLKLI